LNYVVATQFIAPEVIKEYQDIEKKLREIDRYQKQVDSTKNALEAYVYKYRAALNEHLGEFVTTHEANTFINDLNSTESWLYDEGMRESLEVYQKRLEGLKSQGDKYSKRYNEWTGKDEAVNHFYQTVQHYKEIAGSGDEKYAHINNLSDIFTECDRVGNIIHEKLQEVAARTDEPTFLNSDIRERATNLATFCQKILNTPKPKVEKPTKTEEATPENTQNEQNEQKMEVEVEEVMDID